MAQFEVSEESIAKLRGIRLYHWRQTKLRSSNIAFYEKQLAKLNPPSNTQMLHDYQSQQYNQHMLAVQALNDFFEVGDTAENDDNES